MEIWKDIDGYPDYMVSNMGRVKSLERNVVKGKGGLYKIEEKILKSIKKRDGYLQINLSKDGKQKTHLIHRLVAQAFLLNPNNLVEIKHIDEDKTNNRADNLEWCSREYNCNYGTRNKRISIPILQLLLDGKLIRKWNSAREVERELNIAHNQITACCKGKYKTAGGYKWGYVDDYERIPFKVFDLEIYKKKVV